eukprot:9258216-Pyramimonas_sp.AAC.1
MSAESGGHGVGAQAVVTRADTANLRRGLPWQRSFQLVPRAQVDQPSVVPCHGARELGHGAEPRGRGGGAQNPGQWPVGLTLRRGAQPRTE